MSGALAILGGKSAMTAANDGKRVSPGWKTLMAEKGLAMAAMLFLAILVAGLSLVSSWGLARLLTAMSPRDGNSEIWTAGTRDGQLAILYGSPARLIFALALLAAALGLVAALAINLNKFSLHGAYRARIMRAFLGASRTTAERVPNPFTGFDPQDNIQMHELWPGLLREVSFRPGGLVGFVVKLREHKDAESRDLHNALSPPTQAFLQNHEGRNPPSQSLKRSLLEDVNRLLGGNPGLVGRPSFAARQSTATTRQLIGKLAQDTADADLHALLARPLTNTELADRLTNRRGLLLALNRAALDAVYPEEIEPIREPPPPYRLLHVVGTALNLVGGKRLAWQQRRAESFTISPLHCGSLFRGYRRSRVYGGADGISLGTAMTISGAAVSSNMGYHSSSAAVTMALTLFNARLGWWLGNPGAAGSDRHHTSRYTAVPYRRAFPRLSLAPLCMEAFGLTDDTSKYVLLSDGGHFDNLGLYEMVLRRCRFIVVVDGSQDENARFDDLGAAVRKIRIDLGIDIAFEEPFQIYPKSHPNAKDGKYCAVGTIRYSALDGCPPSRTACSSTSSRPCEATSRATCSSTPRPTPRSRTRARSISFSTSRSSRATGSSGCTSWTSFADPRRGRET